MKTYSAAVAKIPLRRSRSEEFPPLVRDLPLGLTDPRPTERPSPAVGNLQDSPPPADPRASAPSRPFLLPQDDPDAILVDNEEDEFAEGSEAGDEVPTTSAAKSAEKTRVVITHIATGNGESVPVQATEEAAWGATALPEQQEAQYWTYFHRFTELGWDPRDRRVPGWIRDRFQATLREQQQVEKELPPPAANTNAPFYAGRRSQWKGGFAAYPDPPPSPTPFRRAASVRAPLPPAVVEKRKKKNAARTARRNRAAEYKRQEEEVARAQYRPPSLLELPLALFSSEEPNPEPTPLFSSGGDQPGPAPLFPSLQPEPVPPVVMAPPPPPPLLEPSFPVARLRPRRSELAVGGAPPPFLPLSGTVSVPPAPSRVRCPVPLPPLPPLQLMRPGGLVAPEFLPAAPPRVSPRPPTPLALSDIPFPPSPLGLPRGSPAPTDTLAESIVRRLEEKLPFSRHDPEALERLIQGFRDKEERPTGAEAKKPSRVRWKTYGSCWTVSWRKSGPRCPPRPTRNRGLLVPILFPSGKSGPSPRFTGPPSCNSTPPIRDEETDRGNAPEDGPPKCQQYGRLSVWFPRGPRWNKSRHNPTRRTSRPSTSLTLPSPRAYCRNEELNRIRELARRMAAEFPKRYPRFSQPDTAPPSPDPDRPKTPEWREVSPAPSTPDTPPFWAPLDQQPPPATPPCPATTSHTRSPSPEGIGNLVIADEAEEEEATPPEPVAVTPAATPSPDEEEDEAAFLTAEEDMDEE